MRTILTHSLLALAALGMAACSSGPSEPTASNAPAVTLDALVIEPTGVPATREWDGRIEAIERATLAAQTGGRVADIAVDVGDVVEEGDVVVRFTSVEQKAGQRQALAALEAARAGASEAAANFRRVEDIHARHLVAQSEFDRAKAANEAAQARLAAARAALKGADEQVGYTAIRAPYRGVVTARHVEPGETVAPGQPLVSGLSLDRLRLVVEVPQRVALRLDRQTRAFVVAADGTRIAATGVTVFPQADPLSHTVPVRLNLPEAQGGFLPGMSAKAVFELEEGQVLTVPAAALSVRGEIEAVLMPGEDGRIELRQVRSGRRLENGEVEVLAGLVPGERVARDAAAALEARRAQRAQMKGR